MIIDDFFGTPIDDLVYRYGNRITDIENSSDCNREYEFDIHLDKFEPNTPIDTKAVFIKGDRNTSILKSKIYRKGRLLDLTGCTVTVNVQEESQDIVTCSVDIVDANNGQIKIDLPTNIVDDYGVNLFEVNIYKDDKVIVSQLYSYTVLDSLGEGEIGTETELTLLQNLISQIQESKNMVDEIVNELEVTQSDIDDILGMVGGL